MGEDLNRRKAAMLTVLQRMKAEIDRALTVAPCVIVMVGLPARGKTYMARKLTRYLNWVGITTKVFNVGEYRRIAAPDSINCSEFFRSDNSKANEIRERCAIVALEDLSRWLKSGGEVAVYDATNSVRSRRRMVKEYVEKLGFKLFFVESVCFDPQVIEANIREVKLSSPDYMGVDREQAIEDFRRRIKNYEQIYETLDVDIDADLSFIKIFDLGAKFLVNGVRGHVESRCIYYLMNIHVLPRTIYLTRHGETIANVSGRIEVNSPLTRRGQEFAESLAEFMNRQELPDDQPLTVWTSIQSETKQTAKHLQTDMKEEWKALNELDAGICEGMTYKEIEDTYPDEYELRQLDKFYYRYPAGESYQDLVTRLEPVIMELERRESVLVIGHQAILRCLLAYFSEKSINELPYLEIPLHTVVKLTPVAYGCRLEYMNLGIPAVSTHRPRPDNVPVLSDEELKKTRRRQSSGHLLEAIGRRQSRASDSSGCARLSTEMNGFVGGDSPGDRKSVV